MTIRPERPEDAPEVRRLNEIAFGQPVEADLVDRLRRGCTDTLSLVAEDRVLGSAARAAVKISIISPDCCSPLR